MAVASFDVLVCIAGGTGNGTPGGRKEKGRPSSFWATPSPRLAPARPLLSLVNHRGSVLDVAVRPQRGERCSREEGLMACIALLLEMTTKFLFV